MGHRERELEEDHGNRKDFERTAGKDREKENWTDLGSNWLLQ